MSAKTAKKLKKAESAPEEETSQKRNICVVGHKNPDTDSVCAAISYAYLKNHTDSPYHFIPARAGEINAETQFVLDYFHVETPALLENIGTRVKDMDIVKVPGARSNISLRRAWTLMQEQHIFTLPITTSKNKLKGLITINDIAKSSMEGHDREILAEAKTPYSNILETLDAKMIVGNPKGYFDKGKILIATANPDVMEDYIHENDMVILGNRYEAQLSAIEMRAGCIVICLDAPVSASIQQMAKEHNCTVIVTPLDTYTAACLINQSIPVEYYMKPAKELLTFRLSDYTESIRDIMSQKRYRDFPVLDDDGYYAGTISRRNLLGVRKRGLILVDHNEVSQAVDNVLDAEILEVIDHHRIGSLETIAPVYFRNQPVGSTCTIIYQIFHEKGVEIPSDIAGLMCSAILSDTLIFRSPTCTPADISAAEDLAGIAGIDCESYAVKMFDAGSNFSSRTVEELFYQDFKRYEFNGRALGVGQLSSMSGGELRKIKKRMLPFVEELQANGKMDMICFMLTNIMEGSTDLICVGKEDQEIVEKAFQASLSEGSVLLPGIVSRKKQLIPALMTAINETAEV